MTKHLLNMSQNNFFNLSSFLKDNYDEAQIKENLLNNI